MTKDRRHVYFARFCQLIFSVCCPEMKISDEDVIPSFRLHKRIFQDLTNKDIRNNVTRPLLLPPLVLQFLNQPRLSPLTISVPSASPTPAGISVPSASPVEAR